MIDFISDKFTEIASKCLEKKGKEQGALKKDMQLVFKLSESEDGIDYLIYKNFKPIEVLTFLQVLGVKIDFKGYSIFVPKFIKGALNRFCESDNIERQNVRVILTFDERNEMIIWVYNSNQFVKQVAFESLFNGEDILTET
jgi:hypothetical protein